MKKSLQLFGLFIVVLLGTIFYQKNLVEDFKKRQEEQKRIFAVEGWGELKYIQLANLRLAHRANSWSLVNSKYELDKGVVHHLLKLLGHIKVVRVVPNNSAKNHHLFFSHEVPFVFEFEHGKLECVLGDKQNFSQYFYLQVTKGERVSLVIARVDLPLEGIFTSEQRRISSFYYDQLYNLLSAKPDMFYDRTLFSKQELSNVKIIDFVEDKFYLNLELKSIYPSPIAGIEPRTQKIIQIVNELARMVGQQVYVDVDEQQVGKVIRTISFQYADKTFALKLFRRFNHKIGWFIYHQGKHAVYEVDRSITRIFFMRAQMFWQKAIITDRVKQFRVEKFEKQFSFVWRDKRWWLKRNSKRLVDQQKIGQLIKALSAQADMVELKVPSKQQQRDTIFYITILNHRFAVLKSSGDLIFWDQTRSLLFHYWVGDNLPFDEHVENYLE